MRIFAARLGSLARAEDIVQAMYERIATVPPGETIANPLAYLFRLGSNLILDDVRQRRRTTLREQAWSGLQGEQVGGARASDVPSPEQVAAAREGLQRLLSALDTLPPQTRRAFTLHKLDGLSHAETARALGVSRSAVEKHISMALKLLVQRTAAK